MAKFLIFLKRLAAAFFVNLVFRPGRTLSRFIFYKIVVKVYRFYLYIIKKLGWSSFRNSSIFSFISQKSVHAAVVVLTVILVFTNFTSKTKAEVLMDRANRTILAELIRSEFGSMEEEQLIEEFFDEEAVISPAQQTYLDNLSSVRMEPMAQINPIENSDKEGIDTITRGGALVKPDIASTKKVKRPRREIAAYTVKQGDSISTIAENFGVKVSTILWENNLNSYSIIRPGDKLSILPIDGVAHKVKSGDNLSKIAKKYNIEEKRIIEQNKLTDSSILAVGQKLIIPDGKKTSYARRSSKRYSGINAIKDLVRSPDAKPAAGNKMNWPTEGHRITQYYSWRHHAVDIANKTGTPIYAADAGVVERAGWGKGYGYQIVINHGGGKKTRYAHNSKLFVKKGQKVKKGETIAAMGSTGRSTGPHTHFEVIINGKKYNPLNYIK
ncbi:MAG: peptidoglycan DD-metalloendopeptidase family protein [Actinobacteria bacterium]|nr:peptidoglycan DD-metalloendopeptidase family protein [Actinomycetota bacterium]